MLQVPQVGDEVVFKRAKYIVVGVRQIKMYTYEIILRRKRRKRGMRYSIFFTRRNGQWCWAEAEPQPVPLLFA